MTQSNKSLALDKQVKPWQCYLAYVLCTLINVQPALANVVISGGNTHTIKAGNGVEVVNIATPNGKGLSHNTYQQFNVDKRGLILNNSAEQLAQSQLGGYLQNNPNLTHGAASVILNEVTGASRSQLNGYTEVFGSSAPVILTNPYGITCNGCGFINTPRVTLSTGAPKFLGEELSGFDVSQGSITIEGLGLDGTNQTYFDIISRTVQVNADIHANDLSVITGVNEVAYQTNDVTNVKATLSSTPDIAIDSSLLGGMYAGRIALVATENGVGVNVGNLASSQGSITISADGKILLGDASATHDVVLASSQNIDLEGTLSATRHLALQANKTSMLSDVVVGETVSIKSDKLELENASIEAESLITEANSVHVDDDSVINTETLSLNHLITFRNDGAISASQLAFVSGDTLSLTGNGELQAASLNVNADAATVDTALRSTNAAFDIDDGLIVSRDGTLSATEGVQLTAKDLVIKGDLQAGKRMNASIQEGLTVDGNLFGNDITLESQVLTQKGQLFATNDLTITAKEVALESSTRAENNLSIDATTVDLSDELTGGSELSISAENAITQTERGSLLAGTLIDLEAKSIDLSGKSHSNGSANISAARLALAGAHHAQSDVTVNSDTFTQEGLLATNGNIAFTQTGATTLSGEVTAGDSLTINTKTLYQSGELESNADLSIHAMDISLDGNISSGEALTIDSNALAFTGEMLVAGDAILAVDDATLSGQLKTAGSLAIDAHNTLVTTMGNELEAKNTLTLEAETLNHQGKILSGGDTVITSDSMVHKGSIESGQSVVIDTQAMTQQGKIEANQDVTLEVNSALTTQGNLLAGNTVTLSAKSLDNQADINAGNQITVTTTQALTNQSSGVISGLNTEINASEVSNLGTLQALANLDLTANSLSNSGALIALDNLNTQLSGTLTNNSLVYAGNSANLYNNRLNNYGDILVGKDLTIAKNASLQKSTSVLNSSATIESLGGDISIHTGELTNKRTTLNYSQSNRVSHLSSMPSKGNASFMALRDTEYAPSYSITITWCGSSGCSGSVTTFTKELSFLAYSDSFVLNDYSAISKILALDTLNIEANTVENNVSQISGQDVHIQAMSLSNLGLEGSNSNTYFDYRYEGETRYASQALSAPIPSAFTFDRVDVRTVNNGSNVKLNSSISASNNLTLNVANKVDNSIIQSNAAKVTPSASAKGARSTSNANVSAPQEFTVANVSDVSPVAITFPDVNDVPFPDFRIPTNPDGLFIFSDGPSSGALIETNPALTNLGEFLGSDYFQNIVGFSPEQDITFLGDAFYDTRTITQAIFEQTGQRYLNQSVGSDLTQMKQLIDAAAVQKQALNLKVGIALSAEQVASLTQDMVWYETIEVNGQAVLAPKLYLAQITQRDFMDGAVIAGGSLEIDAGEINNSGALHSNSSLKLTSESALLNDTGSILASDDLVIQAEGDITNLSGQISGESVTVVSTDGSIINQSITEQLNINRAGQIVERGAEDISHTNTFFGDTATIRSKGALNISASKDITNIGADIQGGESATLQAGGDITLASIEDKHYDHYRTGHTQIERAKVEYRDSTVASQGPLTIAAGNDITASGGTITAAEDLKLAAGGGVTLMANQTHHLEREDTYNKKDTSSQTRQQGTTLSAGGNLSIVTGGDTSLVASELSAEQDLTIQAGGELYAIAGEETDYSRTYRKSSSFWGKSTSDVEISSTTMKGTSFNADSITLISKDSQLHQASVLNANQNIHLESTDGMLAFKAAEESKSYREESKKSGVMVKMQGQGETSTTQKLTSMQSGGDITLASALGIEVDYVSTDNTLGKALAQIPANGELAWMAELKDNPNVNWNEVNEAFDSWSYSEQSLSGPAAAIIAIAVAVVTAGAGVAAMAGQGLAGAVGGGTTVAAMGSAATSALISQASLSLINNGGDIGATLKQLGSSESIKVLATATLTAGALAQFSSVANSAAVNDTALASGNPNYMVPAPEFSFNSIANHVGESTIRAGIDTAINDADFADSFTNSLRAAIANDIGAFAANEIGDFGQTNNLANGGITKTVLHGLSQGVVAELAGGDFKAGLAAGAVTELTGELIGKIEDQNTQVDVAGLVGATAGLIATGDAEGAYTGQNAGGIVHQNNYLNHTDIKNALKEFVACNGEAECELRVIVETKALSDYKDQIAQADCGEGNCREHSRELANATLPQNADVHYELIGDNQNALDFYQLMAQANNDAQGPMTDASIQKNLTDWAMALGFNEEEAKTVATSAGLITGLQRGGRKKVSGSNVNAVSDGINGPPKSVTKRGWKVGDDVYNLTAKGNEPSWTTVRTRFWKNQANATDVAKKWGAENIERMRKGRAPQRYNADKGGMESMELSHEPIPFRDGGKKFVPRWPQDHAAVDPFRHPGY